MADDPLQAYVAQIRRHMPELHIDAARLNRDGLANDVVVVNDELAFRFPKGEGAGALQRYEVALLAVVRRHVTVAVPAVEEQTDAFTLYRYLPGEPLYRHRLLRLGEREQEAVAHDIGAFLSQLHAIPLAELPPPPWQAGPAVGRRQAYLAQLDALRAEVYPLLWADQRAWAEDLFAPLADGSLDLDAFAPACVHDDLAPYHLLYDPALGRLSGVIDFGTAAAGDPAKDLALLMLSYGEGFLRRVGRAYPLGQGPVDRARLLAGALELEWALKGVRARDPEWLLVHLGRARDIAPGGAPWRG